MKSGHLSHVYLNFQGHSWPKVTPKSLYNINVIGVVLEVTVQPAQGYVIGPSGVENGRLFWKESEASGLREEGQRREKGHGVPV